MRAMKKNAAQYIQASMFKNQYVQKQFENTASEDLVKVLAELKLYLTELLKKTAMGKMYLKTIPSPSVVNSAPDDP